MFYLIYPKFLDDREIINQIFCLVCSIDFSKQSSEKKHDWKDCKICSRWICNKCIPKESAKKRYFYCMNCLKEKSLKKKNKKINNFTVIF